MRPVIAAVVAAAVASIAAGCASDPASDASSDPSNDPDAAWMQPAGTPMGADLVVPQGAQLVGPVFSSVSQRSPIYGGDWYVDGQQGYLLSDADISQISDDLVAQLGGPQGLQTQYNDTVCNQEIDRGGPLGVDTQPYTDDLDADAVEIICSATLPNGVSEVGEGITFDLRQDATEADTPVQGVLTWSGSSVEVPTDLPQAPGVNGDTDVITSDVEGDPDLEVVEGSFLAGPQGWGSITGGFTAVVGVTGDPDEVFDAYMAYINADPVVIDQQVGALRVRQGQAGGAGGVTYTVTLNEMDGNAWILLEAYND